MGIRRSASVTLLPSAFAAGSGRGPGTGSAPWPLALVMALRRAIARTWASAVRRVPAEGLPGADLGLVPAEGILPAFETGSGRPAAARDGDEIRERRRASRGGVA